MGKKGKRPKIQPDPDVPPEERGKHRHANPEMARGRLAIASSNKAGPHQNDAAAAANAAGRTGRMGSRTARERAAIADFGA